VSILTRPAGAQAELLKALYDEHAPVLRRYTTPSAPHGPARKSEPWTDG
jgi:hypothetical protein